MALELVRVTWNRRLGGRGLRAWRRRHRARRVPDRRSSSTCSCPRPTDTVIGIASRPETADIPVVVLTAKTLEAGDHEQLDGRIAFVASKSALDLDVLAPGPGLPTGRVQRPRNLSTERVLVVEDNDKTSADPDILGTPASPSRWPDR
jgi:hypothetical protein